VLRALNKLVPRHRTPLEFVGCGVGNERSRTPLVKICVLADHFDASVQVVLVDAEFMQHRDRDHSAGDLVNVLFRIAVHVFYTDAQVFSARK
jgi:hypothetical protein